MINHTPFIQPTLTLYEYATDGTAMPTVPQKVATLESELSQIRGVTPPSSLSHGQISTPLSTSRVRAGARVATVQWT